MSTSSPLLGQQRHLVWSLRIIICIFPPGANFVGELWSCDIGALSCTCGNWMNVSCMKANRAVGRQVKIKGKPSVKANK